MDIQDILLQAEQRLQKSFERYDAVEYENFSRIMSAFRAHRLSVQHFAGTTGYGYGDIGRDTLEHVFADVFGAEDALVRPQIVSGTHALAVCLFGLLQPGDHLLSAAGKPYDTLDEVIGITGEAQGSLRSMGVSYSEVALTARDEPDIRGIVEALRENTRVVQIQRSRGYAWRNTLCMDHIAAIVQAVHAVRPDCFIMVDNCYGEFVDVREPSMVGADAVVGSLIKNAGGGIAPTGGYIVGNKRAIARVESRLTSPGIGREVGSYAPGYQAFFQGLFMAPHIVCQALKSATLAASVFDLLGFRVHPTHDASGRGDIIQAIEFGTPDRLIAFCKGIQSASPVDSFATPEPWDMPGYQHQVIMAAGTFVSGASIELSADAPMRPPYIGYLQGGLTYAHGRLGLQMALSEMQRQGLLP